MEGIVTIAEVYESLSPREKAELRVKSLKSIMIGWFPDTPTARDAMEYHAEQLAEAYKALEVEKGRE